MRLLTAILSTLPLPALALSCIPYGVSDAYLEAATAKEAYVPVLGLLSFDVTLNPQVDWENQQDTPATTLIPATFTGDALTVRGVDTPFATDVVLEVRCLGPWCASPQPGPVLGFLRKTSHSYVLSTHACGGYMFGRPDAGQIKQVRDCLAGKSCQATAPR